MRNLQRASCLIIVALINGCGVELSDTAMLRVKTVGDPYPACSSERCDKAWQDDLFSLTNEIAKNKNIVPVALLESEQTVIDITAVDRAIEVRGFALAKADVPCREVDATTRISAPAIPELKDFGKIKDGAWKICAAAIVPPEGRNLYNSPTIILDKTAPEKKWECIRLRERHPHPNPFVDKCDRCRDGPR